MINFTGDSKIQDVFVSSSAPILLKVDEAANVSIKNIQIAPQGDNIRKNRVKLDGDFGNSSILVGNSAILNAGENFKISSPIKIMCESSGSTVQFSGDFINASKIDIYGCLNIEGNYDFIPSYANIRIVDTISQGGIKFSGDLSQCNLIVDKDVHLYCSAEINNVTITSSANSSDIFLDYNAVIENMDVYSLLYIEGCESAVNEIMRNVHIYGSGKVVILGLFKETEFIGGKGQVQTGFTEPGKYSLTIKIKQGDKIVELPEKLPITILS